MLELKGGKKGLLINSRNLCEAPQHARVKMTGQNGAAMTRNPALKLRCGKKGAKGSGPKRHLFPWKAVGLRDG